MSRNIVIFGPAHAGKSTLAGFLIAGHQPEDLARVKIMLSSGQHGEISEADKYRLLLDKHDEERRRNREPGHGTSWYMHTAPTRIGHFDFLLIDTPGREHERSRREMLRGMFYGDVALLLLEVNWFTEENQDRLFADFAQLTVWLSLDARRDGLIVVISKMDTAAFSEVRFREASSLCESLIGSISASNKQSLTPLPLAIIPSAIDCINEIGHNLYVRTKEFDWYKGATVAETLQEFATRSSQLSRSKDLPLVLCIRKTYDKPYVRPKGLVLEGKIMSGAIKDQERVKIVPVGTKAFGWVALTGHIAELRKIAEPARISIGSAGDMISANCTDLRFRGKSITREQMNVGPSSLILKESTQCDVGTVAVFSIDRVPAVGLGVLEQVLLIWFGRSIPAHVVAIDLDNGKIFIEAEQDPLGVALDEESVPLHRDFVIRQQTGSTSGSPEGQRPARYIPIQLEQVGTPERLAYSGSDLFSVEEIKNRHWHSPVERTETGVLFNAPIGYEMLLREIKMFETEVGDRGRAILRQMRVSLGPPDRM